MSTCKAYWLISKDLEKYIPQVKMASIEIHSMRNARITNTQSL